MKMGSKEWKKLNPTCKHCHGGGFPGNSNIPEDDVCKYCGGKGYIDLSAGEKEPIICSYCGETVGKTMPTPFWADRTLGWSICKTCWDDTRETYLGSTGEDIGAYENK